MRQVPHRRIPIVLAAFLIGLALAAISPARFRPTPAGASPKVTEAALMGTGVGMYTDPSVASQVSSFTINPPGQGS